MARVRREEIYDALLDDESFAALPHILAKAFGARSCVLHWRHEDGGAEILTHSGYFSDAQMLNYAENFVETDLWTLRASDPSLVNKVWNCEQVVSSDEYARSTFYNEWIRAMGDDTFYCIGTVMTTRWGQGIVGMHRGCTQSAFATQELEGLSDGVVHLRRMLGLRGRIVGLTRKAEHLEAIVEGLGEAMLAVSASGRIVHVNVRAEAILQRSDALRAKGQQLVACSPDADAALQAAIARAGDPAAPTAAAVAVPRRGGGRYELSLTTAAAAGARLILVIVRDPASRDRSLEERLRDIYGLSAAEARLAVRLYEGATLADHARERGVALSTVRSQLKSLQGKLDCHRQADVVRLVARLPAFPNESMSGRGAGADGYT